MNFAISDLRKRPEFFDAVADRIWQAWWKPRGVALNDIRGRLNENLRATPLPCAFVAHRGDAFLGTASLIASDMDERPHYSPWVAAVWTEPNVRGQGIGRMLVAGARDKAFALGHDRVYLCARPEMRGFYLELGWTVLEDGVGVLQLAVFMQERHGYFTTPQVAG